jgi:hypothetical protein
MAADLTGTCCVVHSQKQGMSDLTRQRSGELPSSGHVRGANTWPRRVRTVFASAPITSEAGCRPSGRDEEFWQMIAADEE